MLIESNKYQIYSPLLVLDFGLDIIDSIRGFNLESDGFTREAMKIINKRLIISTRQPTS